MNNVKKALPNYLKILDGIKKPLFKTIQLDKKIETSFGILKNCELCERKCKIDRTKGGKGWCKAGNNMEISSYFDHYAEEPMLIPSFTIFFIGCTFSCQFCQNWTISQRIEKGDIYSEEELAKIIDEHSYCKNVNFVGGEPTAYLPFILKTLSFVKSNIPVVWNSNFYMSEKSMELLKGVVDVYLPDFKYGNNKCAERLSKVKNYFNIVSRNHLLAFKDAEMIIRHLVLPNHFECCTKPILDWISKNLGQKVIVNIMDQYKPEFLANKTKDISRSLTAEEFTKTIKYAEELDINFIP